MPANRKKQTALVELETFVKTVNDDVRGLARTPLIPGFDSYAPSYLSDGTDRRVGYGQLEPNPDGNKQIS